MLVAGDVYDLSAPSAPAQQLVVQTLLRMRRAGAEVIVIAGNHDHGPTFEAYRPLMGVAGITLAGTVPVAGAGRRGPVHRPLRRRADVQVAVLPFLSQRYAVRAAEIVANTPSENVRAYDEQVRQVIGVAHRRLRRRHGQPGDVAPHLRRRHLRRRRAVGPVDLRVQRARDHLPRLRALRGARPPAPAAVAARARPGALQRRAARGGLRRAGQHQRRLPGRGGPRHPGPGHRPPGHRPGGGCAPCTARWPSSRRTAGGFGDDYLRVYLREPTRAGLRDDTVAILPNALEVRIDPEFAPPDRHATGPRRAAHRAHARGSCSPTTARTRDVSDPRVAALFARAARRGHRRRRRRADRGRADRRRLDEGRKPDAPDHAGHARLRLLPRARRASTSPTPTSSPWSARPARASRR